MVDGHFCFSDGLLTQACDNLTISIEKKVEDITKKMSEFSWKILETVPPMVSTTVSDTLFCKDWHEKEMSPEWNEELENYDLEYYRPVLFFSYEGKVSQKGWVGNTPASVDSVTAKEFCLKSYKKPCLKVKQMASLGSASEQSKFDPDPSTSDVPGTKETYDKSANQTDQDTPSSGYLIGLRKYT